MRFGRQLIAMVIVVVIINLCGTVAVIPSASMEKTLLVNDLVYYQNAKEAKQGDIIIFEIPSYDGLLTKRVIASGEGTRVMVADDGVYINGTLLKEDYLDQLPFYTMDEITLKDQEYFCMGDNRKNSQDCRFFGPITKDNIRGKLIFRIPFGKIIKKGE